MTALLIGLIVFLGAHSVRIVADDWRTGTRARLGENAWKLRYTLVSLLGFGLIVWGYGQARTDSVLLWSSPAWTRHLAGLLMLVSFVLLAASNVPRNGIKARVHHPMTLGVKVWAFAHLLANGTLADLLLFGSFLVWSVVLYRSARRRDRAAGTVYPPGTAAGTGVAVVAGVALWALFAFWAHQFLIGVRPFG